MMTASRLHFSHSSSCGAFGPKELSYLLEEDGVINIGVQPFLLKRISEHFTERNLVVLVFYVLSLGYIAAGFATNIPTLAFAVLCISTGVALARPTFMAALPVQVPQERQGVVTGTVQSLVAVTDIADTALPASSSDWVLTEQGSGRWWRLS